MYSTFIELLFATHTGLAAAIAELVEDKGPHLCSQAFGGGVELIGDSRGVSIFSRAFEHADEFHSPHQLLVLGDKSITVHIGCGSLLR